MGRFTETSSKAMDSLYGGSWPLTFCVMNFSVAPFISEDINRVEADLRMRTVPGFREEVREATDAAAKAAATYAYDHAPFESGNLRQAINYSPSIYRAGGAGGGGSWESVVGVYELLAPHAKWLLSGTGIYGPNASPIHANHHRYKATKLFKGDRLIGPIFRSSRDLRNTGMFGVMTFQKQGEPRRYRKFTTGQPAQTEWWFGALAVAEETLARRLRTIDMANLGGVGRFT